MAALSRWGIWKRVGMSAVIGGLDLNEAMATLPSEVDLTLARRLFIAAEAAYVPACLKYARDTKDE